MSADPSALTANQSRVLDFMALHVAQRQRAPTRKEICQQFKWASLNAAEEVIQALERKGFIALEGSAAGSQWQRYPRIIRWPANVLPVLQLAHAATAAEAAAGRAGA